MRIARLYFYKFIIIASSLFVLPTTSIWFESRYLVPDLTPAPLLSSRLLKHPLYGGSFTFQPFLMMSRSAYAPFKDFRNSKQPLYDIGGSLDLLAYGTGLVDADFYDGTLLNQEVVSAGGGVAVQLEGYLDVSGVACNFVFSPWEGCTLGWSSSFYEARGLIEPTPRLLHAGMVGEYDELAAPGIYDEFVQGYANIMSLPSVGLNKLYYSTKTMGDTELYIRFELGRDYCARMRRLKGALQAGTLLPTSPVEDINNLASFPTGCNGHFAVYAAGNIDLTLKEDMVWTVGGRAQNNFGRAMLKRLAMLNQPNLIESFIIEVDAADVESNDAVAAQKIPVGEPVKYGVLQRNVYVSPGATWNIYSNLTLEGLRDGFGAKVGYSYVRHEKDNWFFDAFAEPTLLPYIESINRGIQEAQAYSAWSQGHFNVTLFYDFLRDAVSRSYEPFFAISLQLPVDWLSSRASAHSYGLSCIFELLY